MTGINKDILERSQKSDRRAQSRLYELCFGFLMPICLRYASCRDDAMSYMNLGFYKILKNLHQYPEKVPFQAWSKRVMINSIIDELRKQKRYQKRILVHEPGELPEPQKQYDWDLLDITAEEIFEHIQSLPPMTGSVFNLYAIDGYKHKEIAHMLEISVGTSKWHYSEARKRLKARILKTRIKERIAS